MSKTVLITGASGGIGSQIAITFAKNDYNVVLCGNKNFEHAQNCSNKLNAEGYSTFAVRADICNKAEINKLFLSAENRFGNVDTLVNNAGIAQYKQIQDVEIEDIDKMFTANVYSAIMCSKIALQSMINKKSGEIINISSIWGQEGASCETIYSATKAALIGFTKALAKEVAPSGIRVNCVAPGVVNTKMMSDFSEDEKQEIIEGIPLGRMSEAKDVANAVLFLAQSSSKNITGHVLAVNGGMYM